MTETPLRFCSSHRRESRSTCRTLGPQGNTMVKSGLISSGPVPGDMAMKTAVRSRRLGFFLAVCVVTVALAPTAQGQVTFTKNVAPILQERCQSCHHAGTFAPMSLMTYEETRPYAKAIKAKIVAREMPD